MANCKVRSYKAKGGWIKWLIGFRSKPHWHTEFQFSERYDGVSYSATMQDGDKGCRFKQIEYSHPNNWTTHIIELADTQEDMAHLAASFYEDCKYDLWGLLSFGTKWQIIKPSKYKIWCTECVCILLNATDKYKIIPDQMHPQGLVEYLDERIQK